MATRDIWDDVTFPEKALSVKGSRLPKFLENVCKQDGDNILCEYFMIACSPDNILEKEFIDELGQYLIFYALRRGEYSDPTPIEDAHKITLKAINRFVNSSKTGEPGELILFLLLESQRNAPQILNKMSLKTSGNVHFHGLDGIHIGIKGDEIILYYGESKIEKSIDSAIKNAVDVLDEFHITINREKHELDLINNHIDVKKFGWHVNEIQKIVDPYSRYKKEKLRKVYSVFIGFDWSSIINLDFKAIEKDIKKLLITSLDGNKHMIHGKCKGRIIESNIDNSIEFFFLPFKDVQNIRKYFNEGVLNRGRI